MEILYIKPSNRKGVTNPTLNDIERILLESELGPIVIRTSLGVGVIKCLCMDATDHPEIGNNLNTLLGFKAVENNPIAEQPVVEIIDYVFDGFKNLVKLNSDNRNPDLIFETMRKGLLLKNQRDIQD